MIINEDMINEETFVKGILKVRGDERSLINFLVDACECWLDEDNALIIAGDIHYLEGTHNAFIDFTPEFVFDGSVNGIIFLKYVQRFYVRAKDLKELSKAYNVDFKISAFENNMKYCRDIEVVGGKIIKNNKITSKALVWQFPFLDVRDLSVMLNQFLGTDYLQEDVTPNEFYEENVPDELKSNSIVPIEKMPDELKSNGVVPI